MPGLVYDLLARDKASPVFGKLGGAIGAAAKEQSRFTAAQLEAERMANRLKIAELQVAAATERHATVAGSASASIARQANAEIGLIRANQGLAEAHAASAAAAAKSTKAHVAGEKAAAAGAAINRKLTLPLLALGGVAVHEATQYQKSMTLIQTAGGESADKAAAISKGLLNISRETGTSLDQLGEGIYTVAKAGAAKWSATDQLKVMRAASQGAKAEMVPLGEATDALSTVMLDYHLSASKAVATENQLVKASGLAKTNFADFGRSLSNVMPIAAALGVKKEEVLGGLATMTQHGVSPQQASENMRNLLFNLAGQNNVASQAMQQLGINTVDLTKHLSDRGLTGTLKIVDDALKAHTKNGMVVTDTHKSAALATRSLDQMLGDMTGTLHKQSAGLLSGKVGMKDYKQYAMSLGGQAGASALQFLALEKNSLGFSNQLKAGKGTISTSTAQMNKLLGGMTGASVQMQIAGKYADDNARNVREVGQAALEAGTDVLGWNKTQDTLAVKMDKAKASLQVMAVEIGTTLIPAVSKAVDWVGRGVHSFDNLSSTQKSVAGWSIGAVAALGPVTTLGTKLVGAGSKISTFATALSGSSRLAAGSLRVLGTAAVAGGVGYGIGTLTQNASGAAQAVGTLASTATGALVGFGAGGPIGAAIGGGVGLLANLAGNFLDAGKAAHSAIGPTDDFTNAILRDNKALGANTRNVVANRLNKPYGKGNNDTPYDDALKLGINQRTLTDAVMGNEEARRKVGTVMAGFEGTGAGASKLRMNYLALKSAIGDVGAEMKVNQHAADNFTKANSAAGKAASAQATEMKRLAGVQATVAAGSQRLNPQVAKHGVSLGADADGRSNAQFFGSELTKISDLEKAEIRAGVSMSHARSEAAANTKALRDQAAASGFAGGAVDKLVKQYKASPKDLVLGLVGDLGKSSANAKQLTSVLDSVKGGKVKGLSVDTKQGQAAVRALQDRINVLNGVKAQPKLSLDAKLANAAIAETKQGMISLSQMVVDPAIKLDAHSATVTASQFQLGIDAIKQHKIPGLSAKSDQGRSIIRALQGQINALKQHGKPALGADPGPAKTGVATAQSAINALHGKRVPVGVDPGPAEQGLQRVLNLINGSSATVTVNTRGGGGGKGKPKVPTLLPGTGGATGGMIDRGAIHRATGGGVGLVRGPGTGTSDDVPAFTMRGNVVQPYRLSDGEFVVREKMTRKHRHLIEMINGDRLAAGGAVHKSGKGWEYGGKYYTTEKSAQNAADKAAYEAKKDAHVKAASGVYRVGRGYGFEGQYYDHAKDANAARRDSRHQAAASGRYQYSTDFGAYASAIGSGDVDQTKSAYDALMKDARGAGASKRALDALARSEKTVIADLQRRAAITEQVSKAQDYLNDLASKAGDMRSSVRGAFTGTFDIANASPTLFNDRPGGGTIDAILKSVTGKADKAASFGAMLTKLGKEGLSPTLLSQLAAAGPTPEAINAATALSAATPAKIGQLNAQYKRLDTAGDQAGSYAANLMFGSQIAVAKALINGYSTKNPAMKAAVSALATSLFGAGKVSGQGLERGLLGQKKAAGDAGYQLGRAVDRELRRSLRIKSPSRATWDVGTNAGSTFAKSLLNQKTAVASASAALGLAAVPNVAASSIPTAGVPSPAPSGGSSSGDTYNDNRQYFEFHEALDIGEIEMRIARRNARRGP